LADVENVFFEGVGIDEDVIEIGDSKLIEELMDDIIDVRLERTWGVAKTKRHDEIFEVTIAGTEGCFEFVSMLSLVKYFAPLNLSNISEIKGKG